MAETTQSSQGDYDGDWVCAVCETILRQKPPNPRKGITTERLLACAGDLAGMAETTQSSQGDYDSFDALSTNS